MPAPLWSLWWAWIVAGFVLGVIEVLVPGFIFVGFAVGAVLTGALVGLGVKASLPVLILIFALLSLASWLVVRRLVGRRPGQVKIWDRDINDND